MLQRGPAAKTQIPNPVICGSAQELAKHKVNSFPAVNTPVQRAGKPSGLQHCRLVAS
jgi:hypothetical protein